MQTRKNTPGKGLLKKRTEFVFLISGFVHFIFIAFRNTAPMVTVRRKPTVEKKTPTEKKKETVLEKKESQLKTPLPAVVVTDFDTSNIARRTRSRGLKYSPEVKELKKSPSSKMAAIFMRARQSRQRCEQKKKATSPIKLSGKLSRPKFSSTPCQSDDSDSRKPPSAITTVKASASKTRSGRRFKNLARSCSITGGTTVENANMSDIPNEEVVEFPPLVRVATQFYTTTTTANGKKSEQVSQTTSAWTPEPTQRHVQQPKSLNKVTFSDLKQTGQREQIVVDSYERQIFELQKQIANYERQVHDLEKRLENYSEELVKREEEILKVKSNFNAEQADHVDEVGQFFFLFFCPVFQILISCFCLNF